MKVFAADLHIHTALSPCGDDEMTPPAIVRAALDARLDIIAICDHNCTGNAAAVHEAAHGSRLTVLPGMEITTAEEAHVLGIFPDAHRAAAASETVLQSLPLLRKSPRAHGAQHLMDAVGRVIGQEKRMLSMASVFSLDETLQLIHAHDGLAIAAHVDRPVSSIMSQLGFIPEDAAFDAIEISAAGMAQYRFADFMDLGLPLTTASDAHFREEIGVIHSLFELETPDLTEIGRAFRKEAGRRCGFA